MKHGSVDQISLPIPLMARCQAHAEIEKNKETLSQMGIYIKISKNCSYVAMKAAKNSIRVFQMPLKFFNKTCFRAFKCLLQHLKTQRTDFQFNSSHQTESLVTNLGPSVRPNFWFLFVLILKALKRISIVKDDRPLILVIKTYKKKSPDGIMINEFADSWVQSPIFRLQWTCWAFTHRCCRYFRCTAGLEQPSSESLYENMIINASDTSLYELPGLKTTMEFSKSEFEVQKKDKRNRQNHLQFQIIATYSILIKDSTISRT